MMILNEIINLETTVNYIKSNLHNENIAVAIKDNKKTIYDCNNLFFKSTWINCKTLFKGCSDSDIELWENNVYYYEIGEITLYLLECLMKDDII